MLEAITHKKKLEKLWNSIPASHESGMPTTGTVEKPDTGTLDRCAGSSRVPLHAPQQPFKRSVLLYLQLYRAKENAPYMPQQPSYRAISHYVRTI